MDPNPTGSNHCRAHRDILFQAFRNTSLNVESIVSPLSSNQPISNSTCKFSTRRRVNTTMRYTLRY